MTHYPDRRGGSTSPTRSPSRTAVTVTASNWRVSVLSEVEPHQLSFGRYVPSARPQSQFWRFRTWFFPECQLCEVREFG